MSGSFLLLFSPTSLNFKNVASRRASSILLPLIQPRKHFQTATTTSLSPSQFFRQPRFLNFSVVGRIVRRFAPVARSVSRIKRREKETRERGRKRMAKGVEENRASNRCSCSQAEFDVTPKCSDAGNDRMRISTRQEPVFSEKFQ